MASQPVFRHEPLPPLPVLEREWRALEAVGDPSFFTSWHWIGALLAVTPAASRPNLLRGIADRRTVALALLGASEIRRRHGLVRSRALYLNETGDPRLDAMTIEHNGILAAAEWEPKVWHALVAWFAGLRDTADELYFSGSLRRLPAEAIAVCGLVRRQTSLPSYSVDLAQLEESDGELYPVLSANARQQLRRAARYFERYGPLHLAEASTVEHALCFFDALKALHCASWERRGKPHSFSGEFFEPFHRILIEHSAAAGAIQLLKASAGDRVLGYLYNFRLGNRVYAYQSGFDDADRRERPGVVTHALAIQHAFRLGARVYDFMAGRNRLKESFATRCEPMLWQTIQQPRLAFRLEDFGRRLKQSFLPAARRDSNRARLAPPRERADGGRKGLPRAGRNDRAPAIHRGSRR